MMSRERASIFSDDEVDLSDFASPSTRPPLEKSAIEAAAEHTGFTSREGQGPTGQQPTGTRTRRRITGRNRQLNLKVTEGALDRFYAIADGNKLVLGEAFEMAVAALERELAQAADPQ